MKIFSHPLFFEWDDANRDKNWKKHRVSNEECEETFFDPHKRLLKDPVHSSDEERFLLLGRTLKGRTLFIVFTIRQKMVRVVSARDLNKKERKLL